MAGFTWMGKQVVRGRSRRGQKKEQGAEEGAGGRERGGEEEGKKYEER